MNDNEKLIALVQNTISNIDRADISLPELSGEYRDLGAEICGALKQVQELCRFVGAMADGDLDISVPGKQNALVGASKDLFYKLKHLTWQAQQVAKGDYNQRVDFMGSFSEAFNTMIEELEKREQQIREHAAERIREADRRNARLIRQMEHQLAHYHAYRVYTDSYRDFRARYKEMMGEVYDCFQQGEFDKGRLLVAKINDEMGKKIEVHKDYSNHEFVNASLTDIADICREWQIDFHFLVHIPEKFALEPKTSVSMITTMTEYVLSLLALGGEGQSIDISSRTKHEWLSLVICWQRGGRKSEDEEKTLLRELDFWQSEVVWLAEESGSMFEVKTEDDGGKVEAVLHICLNNAA